MGLLNLTPPVLGQANSVADAATANAFSTIQTWANGNIDETNLANGTAQRLGLNNSGNVGRGKSIIAASEVRTGTTYGLMTTPDRVQGIVLPTDGIIDILFLAYWAESVDAAGRAAIFIGANQLTVSQIGVAAPAVQEASNSGAANIAQPLSTTWYGLTSGGNAANATGTSTPATTGQAIAVHNATPSTDQAGAFAGGSCKVFAAAGTYDVSVQFKASSGTVTALNRRLWVKAEAYG
jgi:hypothetical protein